MDALKRFAKDEEGQTMVEYGLLGALIAVALILGWQSVTTAINAVILLINGGLGAA